MMIPTQFHYHFLVVVLVASSSSAQELIQQRWEGTQSLFVFSDSLGDTGNGPFVNHPTATKLPFGITFPGYPTGRFSDGRVLAADYIAQFLRLQAVKPWLNVLEDFREGANYAIPGATATDLIPFPLQKQVDWHLDLVSLSRNASARGGGAGGGVGGGALKEEPRTKLPSLAAIEDGLFVIQIGGLDYRHYYLDNGLSPEWVNSTIVPLVADEIQIALERLYNDSGARKFLVVGIPAQGCLSSTLAILTALTINDDGCMDIINEICANHRDQVLSRLENLSQLHVDASYTFLDYYDAHLYIKQHATEFGFLDVFDACCGAGPTFPYGYNDTYYHCSNETASLHVCENPANYINWDGVHFTDSFNFQLFNQTILSNSFIYPFDGLSYHPSNLHKELK